MCLYKVLCFQQAFKALNQFCSYFLSHGAEDEQLAGELLLDDPELPNLKYVNKDNLHAVKRNLLLILVGFEFPASEPSVLCFFAAALKANRDARIPRRAMMADPYLKECHWTFCECLAIT